MYKVYVHISPNGKRYFGITRTKLSARWQNGKGYKYNSYFNRAILKYGWENIKHIVLFENLSKEDAEFKEKELIAKYKTTNPSFGYNIDNGGSSTGVHSSSTIEKLRKLHLGRKHSKETKEKHRQATLKLWQSQEFREKIIKSRMSRVKNNNKIGILKNRYRSGKKVICIETKMIFERIKDASIYYGICDECIRKCCHNERNVAGGYHWQFYKEESA